MENGGLLVDLITALGAALVGAAIALKLRQPVIVGYLLAGVAISPIMPGPGGRADAIAELAEIGIVLLMFVVGAQLSLRELLQQGRIAIVGALVQVAAMIGIGYGVGIALGWGHVESYAFGAVLSNSSSTVLSKIVSDRGELESRHAQIALGWSSVQDISTVALVAALALLSPSAGAVGPLLGKAGVFFFVLVPLAVGVLPWLLRHVAALRSREFFVLAVVTVALAMAAGASALGVSLALGAFLAGIVVGESDLAHRILGDTIPLRDVFSGVFFVSIGMLLDPAFVAHAWPLVLLAVALIVVVKGALTAVLARWLGSPTRLAVLVGAALAQSGEFSFLLARIGLAEGALSTTVFNLLLAAAVISILLAPFLTRLAPAALRRIQQRSASNEPPRARHGLSGHAIVCGHGRVGSLVCELMDEHHLKYVVIEEDLRLVQALRGVGTTVVFGDAARPHVLDEAGIATARLLVLCIPERMAVRDAVEYACATNPKITVLARTHTSEDRIDLERRGVEAAVIGETELALELARRTLDKLDIDRDAAERSLDAARRAAT
jgi:monovalent cation:H+ antiporter-2, CPA2 family